MPGRAARRARAGQGRRRVTKVAFYVHLWLGVLVTIALVAIAVTGILLNHKRGLGLMPEVSHEPTGPFSGAISLVVALPED